ncbi:Sulfate permease 2 [Wickerhamiella sorbophila]|uniref:Sulfate permease 2 n=1 Tax=Wickerhamiella sorbophila TaxID=45607 RepID=A0A2T0FNG1_9ASCO|nr:Sulfate permease 2 [Wickerhamiella sorbophila]PRT56520.1 Sulfate permease 2 [Wickerhamiella sorbophila]
MRATYEEEFEEPPRVIDEYTEETVTVVDAARDAFKDPWIKVKEYVLSLFPIVQWIYRYNYTWLVADLTAGLTVGVVVVPQSMSYAQIAGLPVQYGLYSSFVGVILYCIFATSKDVTIGPVAVMSAEVYRVVHRVIEKSNGKYTTDDAPLIATGLALLCGGITAGIGLLRLGFLLDYLSMPAILGFISGSAFTIVVGQVPNLMGINKLFNTRAASYEVVINSFKHLGSSNLNCAFGLVCLFLLYFFKYLFEFLAKRDPRRKKVYFYLSTLRTATIIIFSTVISWAVCHPHKKSGKFPISIVKDVPRGLQDVGIHSLSADMASDMASELPIATVILLLEHISIAKSFGRINDYRINPNQELIAIGVTNLVGHFFSAYPATGSFSRTALKSKCGVRTPLAGIFTGIVVLIAIYALTEAFFYISNAALAAVIIHAVIDLISSWRNTWKIWLISPIECVIFLGDILLCVFVSIEAGVYFAAAASLVWLLLRVSFPSGQFLGRVQYIRVNNPTIANTEVLDGKSEDGDSVDKKVAECRQNSVESGFSDSDIEPVCSSLQIAELHTNYNGPQKAAGEVPQPVHQFGSKWVPLNRKAINKDIIVIPPPPGVFVFRPTESLTYPNASRQMDTLTEYIRKQTRRDIDLSKPVKLGDRPWNDHGPRHRKFDPNFVDTRPILRAVVFDLSATPHIDLTAVNIILDVYNELTKYANRDIEFHFAGILSPWARRALVNCGFGGIKGRQAPAVHQVALARGIRGSGLSEVTSEAPDSSDIEAQKGTINEPEYLPLTATNAGFFHFDIPDLS